MRARADAGASAPHALHWDSLAPLSKVQVVQGHSLSTMSRSPLGAQHAKHLEALASLSKVQVVQAHWLPTVPRLPPVGAGADAEPVAGTSIETCRGRGGAR